MTKEPRLRFTDEERADPAMEKPIRKADKAAAKADKAQAKIPKKQIRQKTVDPETGKVTTKLVLEDKKKPPSKLSHAVRDMFSMSGAELPRRCGAPSRKRNRLFHIVTRWAAEAAHFLKGGKLHGNHTHYAATHRQGPDREPCH